MLAFLVAGVILGVMARVLRHGPDDSSLLATLLMAWWVPSWAVAA